MDRNHHQRVLRQLGRAGTEVAECMSLTDHNPRVSAFLQAWAVAMKSALAFNRASEPAAHWAEGAETSEDPPARAKNCDECRYR